MKPGHVETVYGDIPGCPECGLIPLKGPLLCEHGVTPSPSTTVNIAITFDVPPTTYRLWLGLPCE